jgi:SAM-dependent methyltransferase
MTRAHALPELRLDYAVSRTFQELRSVLFSHGYTESAVRKALGTLPGAENTERVQDLWDAGRHRHERRRDFTSAADALTHLWLLEGALPLTWCARLLGARPTTTLLDFGLLTRHDDWVTASALLIPWRGLWLLTDAYTQRNARDAVFVPDMSSYRVAALLPSTGGALAADLGTGCGLVALAVTPLFKRVVALDVNPRAVAFARCNAAINGRAVIVEQCDPDPLNARLPALQVDLLTFVMPFVYGDAGDAQPVALVSGEGERLLECTYRAVDCALADTGAALLWHQVRLHPSDSFELALRRWGLLSKNQILLELAEMSNDLALGVAVVRRTAVRPSPAILRFERSARSCPMGGGSRARLFRGDERHSSPAARSRGGLTVRA